MEILTIGKFSLSRASAELAESFPDYVLALHNLIRASHKGD
jgi:hypothetical protein